MIGFFGFGQELQTLRISTEILEALDWDDEKLEAFMEELTLMLTAAPPNVQKALFWIRSTPWEAFERQPLPEEVYVVIEKHFLKWEKKIIEAQQLSRTSKKSSNNEYEDDWN